MTEEEDRLREELRLRPARAPVTRLSRTVLMSVGMCAIFAVSGALTMALYQGAGQSKAAEQHYSTSSRQTPEELAALPVDYSAIGKAAVPQLGRPLPGDLGQPQMKPSDPVAAKSASDDGDEDARKSGLFAPTSNGPSILSLPGAEQALGATANRGAASAAESGPGAGLSQNMQNEKIAFVNGIVDQNTVSPFRLERPASRYLVQAGTVINAALIGGIRSDLPGDVTGQVTQHVYDSVTGRILLIPQGSKLIGEYDSQISVGQKRVLVVWTRVILPNGHSIVLERLTGADPQGFAGLEDEVDHHWGQLFMGGLLSMILGIGSQAGATNNDTAIAQAIRQGGSNTSSQVGQQVVGQDLNIQPTLTIRPGAPTVIIVKKDLVLAPYPVGGT
jgi:type IV secretion system protein TrbI